MICRYVVGEVLKLVIYVLSEKVFTAWRHENTHLTKMNFVLVYSLAVKPHNNIDICNSKTVHSYIQWVKCG